MLFPGSMISGGGYSIVEVRFAKFASVLLNFILYFAFQS